MMYSSIYISASAVETAVHTYSVECCHLSSTHNYITFIVQSFCYQMVGLLHQVKDKGNEPRSSGLLT